MVCLPIVRPYFIWFLLIEEAHTPTHPHTHLHTQTHTHTQTHRAYYFSFSVLSLLFCFSLILSPFIITSSAVSTFVICIFILFLISIFHLLHLLSYLEVNTPPCSML